MEPKRIKPRVSIVMAPGRREWAERLAAARGVSLSVLLSMLVAEEWARKARSEKRG